MAEQGAQLGDGERAASRNWIVLVILGLPVVMFGLAGLRAVQLAEEGEVPAALRDLDCDGKVTRIEWLRAGLDFRLRPSTLVPVPGCQDLVHAKSGAVFIVRCPEGSGQPACRYGRDLRAK